MNDTALAGWGELLPLLIFIILGWLANRAKQKKEEELLGNPGQPQPSGQEQSQGGRPVPARRQPHTADDDDEDEEDWTGGEWNREDSGRRDDRRSGEIRAEKPRPAVDRLERQRPPAPTPVSRAPEPKRDLPTDRREEREPLIPAKAKERTAETGKDLLAKLAKELGLELPQPRPVPKPAPAPKTPAKPGLLKTPPSKAPAHATRGHVHSFDDARVRAVEASRAQARPASIPSVAPASAPVAKPLISNFEIGDVESMRKAFVLKTLLDKPLALKPRGFKRD